MKARTLKDVVVQKSKHKSGRIIILSGARQTGKTTLARLSFPEYKYLSIEDPITREPFTRLSADQWAIQYPKAILDEVQKEPVLIESIKSVYDQFETPKYILLGSGQFLLLQQVKESLAGRCTIYDLMPLTLPEIMTNEWDTSVQESMFRKLISGESLTELLPSFLLYPTHAAAIQAFSHYLNFGGYPAVADESLSDDDRREWLYNYIRTYLERDIRDLADFRSLDPFVKTQKTTALLTGSLVNFSQLAREADIAANTARRFLNYLELSYQVILLQPWAKNNLKRLTKTPKLHYLDPGIQRGILRKQGELTGNEFESAVIAEIYKQTRFPGFSGNLYHLKTADGREIDLLIELENGYIAVEIKMTQRVRSKDARHLNGLETLLDKPLIHSFVLSNDMDVKMLSKSITAMPAVMFLT